MLSMNTTLRFATANDAAALDRLAQLDSAELPAAPQLVAIEDGALIAAISARDGATIADPFRRTQDAVELLRRRARQLDSGARVQPRFRQGRTAILGG
jgi:hypothetical protein